MTGLSLAPNSWMLVPNEFAKKLRVGCEVGWMTYGRQFYLQHTDQVTGKSTIPSLFRARGFDHVRITVDDLDLVESMFVEDRPFFWSLFNMVTDCWKIAMPVILSFQDKEFVRDPVGSKARVVEIWRKMADSICNELPNMVYELAPTPIGDAGILNDFYAEVLPVILGMESERMSILSPASNSPLMLEELVLPELDHVTDAGLGKHRRSFAGMDFSFPTSAVPLDELSQTVAGNLLVIADWRSRTGVEVWVSGVMLGDPAVHTLAEQEAFARFFKAEAEKYRIPFALRDDRRFFDMESLTWNEQQAGILNAIIT